VIGDADGVSDFAGPAEPRAPHPKETAMTSAAFRLICRILVATMLLLSFESAQASMIGTDQVISAASAQTDRDAVLSALNRSEVTSQLQSLGIDPQTAKNRVAAMTDQEVHALAGQVQNLPAGALSTGWAVVLVVAIAAVIYYAWK
jgi:hypothetical protein